METVNVLNPEIRNVVRKNVDFLPGAWVDFYDDTTIEIIEKAQAAQATPDIKSGLQIVVSQIKGWNFADGDGKILEVSVDSLTRLSSKFINWLSTTEAELMNPAKIEDKKKE